MGFRKKSFERKRTHRYSGFEMRVFERIEALSHNQSLVVTPLADARAAPQL